MPKSSKKIHIEKNRIRYYFYLATILPLFLVSVIFISIYLEHLKQDQKFTLERLYESVLFEKKLFLKNAIDRTFVYIKDLEDEIQSNSEKKLTKDELETAVLQRLKKYLHSLRLTEKKGYIWVNKIINYEGGDNYAIRVIHPNLPHTEGKMLSTKIEDKVGNTPYQVELDGVKKDGELFYQYYFKRIDSEEVVHKLSYGKLYKAYDWVIATGMPLNNLDDFIDLNKEKMDVIYIKHRNILLSITALLIVVLLFIAIYFESNIHRLISNYDQKITKYTTELELLSKTDQLTKLANRLHLDKAFSYELSRAQRYETPFSIILVDVDKFKRINDSFGHQVGDSVLIEVAQILNSSIRSSDIVGRFGGEEFLIIAPQTDLKSATLLAEKVRKLIESFDFTQVQSVTASFGVTSFISKEDSEQSIFERADKALYKAKNSGRNIVVSS